MSARYFLDTNVFVYCFDRRDRRKRKHAESLVGQAIEDHPPSSAQVVQEFLDVATNKFVRPMNRSESRAYLDTVLSPLCEVFPTIALCREALSLHADTGYSFFGSRIIAAAPEARCSLLYSEDFQDGQVVRELQIVNPFGRRIEKL